MGKFVQPVEQMGIIKRVEPTRDNDVSRAMAGGLNQAFEQGQAPTSRDRNERTNRRRAGLGTTARRDATSVGRKTLLGN